MLTIDVKDSGLDGSQLLAEELSHVVTALNKTAWDAAQAIKEDMPQRFTLRNSWVQKGIRVDNAKRDSPVARVYSVDPYMVKQQDGETWQPDGHVAIPSAARPTKSSPIPQGMLPKALRGRSDIFKFDFTKKPGYKPYPLVGIFQRIAGGRYFKVLYLLKDRKVTKPLWNFDGQVEAAVKSYFSKHFADIGGNVGSRD